MNNYIIVSFHYFHDDVCFYDDEVFPFNSIDDFIRVLNFLQIHSHEHIFFLDDFILCSFDGSITLSERSHE